VSERERVRSAIASFLRLAPEKVRDEAVLTDLVRESFVLVEMVIELQETFDVRFGQDDLRAVRTAGDLVELVTSRAG